MGKTSKSETKQEIDSGLRKEAKNMFSIARQIAGLGYNPYQGMDIAGLQPQQMAAFQAANQAANAFGMPTAAPNQDLMGQFSSFDQMMQAPGAETLLGDIQNVFASMAKKKEKKPKQDGLSTLGGKK